MKIYIIVWLLSLHCKYLGTEMKKEIHFHPLYNIVKQLTWQRT